MQNIITIEHLNKVYQSGHQALDDVNLEIREGEILALLGPNGAGKTTLISIICGIVSPSSGYVTVGGYDMIKDYRQTRNLIGLVPQELTMDMFSNVWDSVSFSRGLYGKQHDAKLIEKILRDLSLWDKKDSQLRELSGGMRRRVLIAKALVHEPKILFLDEPTAGVDVELRQDMWRLVELLRQSGVTVILTTHYIEEAEAIADRVGVINNGQILLLEDKAALMKKLGKKQITIELKESIDALPVALDTPQLSLQAQGTQLLYRYDVNSDATGITDLLQQLREAGIKMQDIETHQSSLEEIFVDIVNRGGKE